MALGLDSEVDEWITSEDRSEEDKRKGAEGKGEERMEGLES